MSQRRKSDAEIALERKNELAEERRISDDRYAMKLVQQIVFWGITVIAGTFLVFAVNALVSHYLHQPIKP